MAHQRDAYTRQPPPTSEPPALPADRAFVVQFGVQEGGHAAPGTGRVEHIVSGRASGFGSWEQLRRFVEGILVGVAAKPNTAKEEDR
jgi:hypothetical protein